MRSPTPTDWGVAPCLDLVNSRFNDHLGSGAVHDRLPLPAFQDAFLRRWGYRVAEPRSERGWKGLRELRDLLRLALESYAGGGRIGAKTLARLESEMNATPFRLTLESAHGGYELAVRRAGGDWEAVAAEIAVSAARLISEGRRVKVCANPDCSWMFVDESRPGSRRWCNAGVCGSLINVRQFRAVRSGRRP